MIILPNGCSCSDLTVHPKNWKTLSASVKSEWYVQYRFYDPKFRNDPRFKKGMLRIVKSGVNFLKTREERRNTIEKIIAVELDLLKNEGYNPITKEFNPPVFNVFEIAPSTTLPNALRLAYDKMQKSKEVMSNIKSALRFIRPVIIKMGMDYLAVSQVKPRHVQLILETVGHDKKKWSAQSFNHYRAYLMMLFEVLIKYGAADFNPVEKVDKQPVPKKLRPLPTIEERRMIDSYFLEHFPNFRRFLHIFFHSGARPVELLRLKYEDIDLKNQFFKVEIKKGVVTDEQERPIKNIAVPFWEDLMSEAKPGQYLFDCKFKPGNKPTTRDQATHIWSIHAMKGLGIKWNLYRLKHANLDETAAILDIKAAAAQAGHTTPVITIKHYALNEKQRMNNKLKEVNNSFTGTD